MQPDLYDAIKYTREHLAAGAPESQLRDHFLAHGWTPAHVDQIFVQLAAPAPPQPVISMPSPLPEQPAEQQRTFKKRYSVIQGFKDGTRAIRANFIAYIVALLVSTAIAIVGTLLLGYVLSQTLLHSFSLIFGSVVSLIGILFTVLVIYLGWISFAGSVIVAATSQAIADGYNGRKQPPLRQFQQGFLGKVLHMTVAEFAANIIIAAPLFITILVPILALTSRSSYSLIQVLSLILGVVTIVWIFVSCLRLAIVPQVALFEPRQSIKQTLRRSNALLRNGGQLYVAVGIVFFIILYVLTVYKSTNTLSLISSVSSGSSSLWLNIGFVVADLIANILLTVLYLDRAGISNDNQAEPDRGHPIIIDKLY
jgi:MFS family permease